MSIPQTTRLRFAIAKDQLTITMWVNKLPFRIQVYGAPVWDGKAWTLWFVPPDDISKDVQSVDLR